MISFFHKIIEVLNENNIAYMLSGSIAMGAYILPRATRDFDFIVNLLPKDIDKFVNSFKEGYYCDQNAVKDAVSHHSMFNIVDHNSGYKADFVILKNEAFRLTEFKRKVKMDFFGKSVYLVSLEDLLISKLIWIQELQSSLQMEDIKMLSEIKTIDWKYTNDWILKLKLNTFNLLKK